MNRNSLQEIASLVDWILLSQPPRLEIVKRIQEFIKKEVEKKLKKEMEKG